jgi:hypothetical protein
MGPGLRRGDEWMSDGSFLQKLESGNPGRRKAAAIAPLFKPESAPWEMQGQALDPRFRGGDDNSL